MKLSPPSVAVLVGVLMLGGIVVGWKMAAPATRQILLRRCGSQVAPDVREFAAKVYVEPSQFVKKGEPLFDISADRFQNVV